MHARREIVGMIGNERDDDENYSDDEDDNRKKTFRVNWFQKRFRGAYVLCAMCVRALTF